MRGRAVLCLLVLLPLAAPTAGHAQGWVLDVSGGQYTHEALAAQVRSSNGVMLGVRREGPRWLAASAGIPLDSAGLAWGAAGAGWRLATRGSVVGLGLDVGAQGFAYHDRVAVLGGGGITAEAMPGVRIGREAIRLEARTGVIHHSHVHAAAATSRTLHQTDARAVLGAAGLGVIAEARYLRAPEGEYPYLGGGVQAGGERLWAVAHAGQWLTESIAGTAWRVAAGVRVLGSTEAQVSVGQESTDPLFWNEPRRSWSVGLSHRLGAVRAPTIPIAAPARSGGGVTFRLPRAASSSAPSVAGDFSGWEPVRLAPDGGSWSVTIPLAPGVYRYAFRGADGEWFVPEGFPGREADGFGGFNAVLIVP